MAQQAPSNDPSAIAPTRYTERRAPQFTGGEIDVASGNLVPANKASYSEGAAPVPAQPTTKLGSMEPSAPPSPPSSSSLSSLAQLSAAAAAFGPAFTSRTLPGYGPPGSTFGTPSASAPSPSSPASSDLPSYDYDGAAPDASSSDFGTFDSPASGAPSRADLPTYSPPDSSYGGGSGFWDSWGGGGGGGWDYW